MYQIFYNSQFSYTYGEKESSFTHLNFYTSIRRISLKIINNIKEQEVFCHSRFHFNYGSE